MCISGNHLHYLHFLTAHLKVYHLFRAHLSELYQTMSTHHYKLFVLSVMPMLALRDTRLGYIHRELSTVGSTNDFGKTTTFIFKG